MKAIFWIGKSGILGTLVRVFKGFGSNHVELLFSDGMSGTSDVVKGICFYRLNYLPENWIAIDIPCTPEEEAEVRKFFEVDEKGCGYDMRGIVFAQVFPWGIESKDKWFCSEACVAALQRVKSLTFLKDLKPYTIDPGELLKILVRNLKKKSV
jgi:hypothetical protein